MKSYTGEPKITIFYNGIPGFLRYVSYIYYMGLGMMLIRVTGETGT